MDWVAPQNKIGALYLHELCVIYNDACVFLFLLQERRFAVSQRERGGLGLPEIGCGHRTSRTIRFHPVRIGPEYRYSRTG